MIACRVFRARSSQSDIVPKELISSDLFLESSFHQTCLAEEHGIVAVQWKVKGHLVWSRLEGERRQVKGQRRGRGRGLFVNTDPDVRFLKWASSQTYLIHKADGIEPDLQGLQAVAYHCFSVFLRLLHTHIHSEPNVWK